ncbi:MAG: hypothetical protein J0H84_26655 [Rhizobiales bacterium]|nr:hypothetical protein [Hyphomicrobiales bacterium]
MKYLMYIFYIFSYSPFITNIILNLPINFQNISWTDMPTIEMKGDLRVFWDVHDHSRGENAKHAYAHGFSPVTEFNTFVDYPGNQKHNIYNFIGEYPSNPWKKPAFFKDIIRNNIIHAGNNGIDVQDIEINFERNVDKAWHNSITRTDSHAKNFLDFEKAYFRAWASWYALPLILVRQEYPGVRAGLFGIQPFDRDYWGVYNKSQKQIDKKHRYNYEIWKYIDKYVDFYISDVYIFYDLPDSIYYIATNVEQNYRRSKLLSNKPIYAYEWLRYHDSNPSLSNREIAPYLAEAMAIIPFFEGARGIVLWGYEPEVTGGDAPPNERLILFMRTLERIGKLSNKISSGQLQIAEPAHVLWRERQPLVRKLLISGGECAVMAIDHWQQDTENSTARVKCGSHTYEIQMRGKHTTISLLSNGSQIEY